MRYARFISLFLAMGWIFGLGGTAGAATLQVPAESPPTGGEARLHAWGNNQAGQLCDGSTERRTRPVAVSLAPGVTAKTIAAGSYHSLAIGSDDRLYACGFNQYGQLGDGDTAPHSTAVVAVLPNGVKPTAISAGLSHSLAIGSDHKLYAWGDNEAGQLGNGSKMPSVAPVAVSLAPGVTPAMVVAGGSHNLALGSNGKLYAWGFNNFGQLGDGTLYAKTAPEEIKLPPGVNPMTVAAGENNSFAIGNDGKLYAWGLTRYGQLGVGKTSQLFLTTPTVVSLPAGVKPTMVAAGDNHGLAIGSDGKLYAWGWNKYGQLGNGTTTQQPVPVEVNLPAGVAPKAIAAGGSISLAMGSDGKLYAWGLDNLDQSGTARPAYNTVPVAVSLPPGATPSMLAVGKTHVITLGQVGRQ